MLEAFFSNFQGDTYGRIADMVIVTAPVWLPILLLATWLNLWMSYKQREWIKDQGYTLLEIKIPREIFKSPRAMELFFNALHQTNVGTVIDVYWKGRVRPWFSLELVSMGGQVRFFIWVFDKQRTTVESQLYAQFPEVEVHEVADYSLGVHHNPEKFKFGWFGQLGLTKADAYPIKTYVGYGLDDDKKEEYKIDPLVSLLEYLGSLKRGENAWIQILIQGHSKEGLKYGRVLTKPDWKKAAQDEIKKFIKENAPTKEGENKEPTVRDLTKDQQDAVQTMERNLGKWAFDTMMRVAYFAEPDAFNPVNIGGLLGSFKQFSSSGLNGFKPVWNTSYNYPWQDFNNRRKTKNERRMLEAYKRRSFFNPPFKNFHAKPYILTTEELATLYHFPSATVAATPTLSRIPSKKAEAPANLPV